MKLKKNENDFRQNDEEKERKSTKNRLEIYMNQKSKEREERIQELLEEEVPTKVGF